MQVSEFWVQVMEKLNCSQDIYEPVPELIQDTCEFFGFGCGFVYVADYTGVFHLRENYLLYEYDHLREKLEIPTELGEALLHELAEAKAVIFSADTPKNALEETLSEIFNARSMILIPINDAGGQLIALVGLVDRRGVSRQEVLDLEGAYAVLCALANHVKLQLYQKRVDNTENALRSILDHMGIDIYVNDFETHEILYVNESMAAPYGGADKLLGRKCWEALYEGKSSECDFCPQKHMVDENGEPTKVYSWDYQRPFDGEWFRVFSAAFNWEDGRLAHVVSSVDITENKRNELIIRQMADYDTLTGLPNRRRLLSDLEHIIDRRLQDKGEGFLLFFDLDGFKEVNDKLGHRAGDELLERIGDMLQENRLTAGKSYRHGGDEFIVLCHEETLTHLQYVLGSIMANFNYPWQLADGEVVCKCSIGVAHYPYDGETPGDLLHNADKAMYAAKRAGKGLIRFYNQGRNSNPKTYLESLSEME
ncbi:sensor domain-containing diguanylate cyclase [Ruminococcaceae bacterium OttesenSCG-928-I18]|nr:sensor domain-containing diguanylate cyclase [Ruminococcaceae bacterium OttesenSCG-928-I18]